MIGLLCVWPCLGLGAERAVAATFACSEQQDDQLGDELAKLREMLSRAGPDGRADREGAVARLLTMPKPEAHRILQQVLLRSEDPDGLHQAIVNALYQHLLAGPQQQFGGADASTRGQILTGYLGALAPLWSSEADATSALRVAARRALQRVPARELDEAAKVLLKASDPAGRVRILRCLADMQQTLLAATIADYLEAGDEVVRDGARAALQLLIYPEQPIRSKAEFEAWQVAHGGLAYIDLVELAARRGPRPLERLREELARTRIAAARDVVIAYVERSAGIDWSLVQARTISEDPEVLDACLDALVGSLSRSPQADEASPSRQAFCRALLDRFRQIPEGAQPELQQRRVRVLEVAAYLARPSEVEVATEIRSLLLAQLDHAPATVGVAALRGLRRFPSVEARATLVARARAMLAEPAPSKELLQAMFDTLSSRSSPRWPAPSQDDADKADWLSLVDAGCRSASELELRTPALKLAQTLDANDLRVPGAFGVLLALVRDPGLATKDRSTALLYLEAWRADQQLAPEWVQALQALLEDPAPALRATAAESLAKLPESSDSRRGEWFDSTLMALRDRLGVEPDASVMLALVECVKACGKEQGMPEKAIGVLRGVLDGIGQPVAPEQQFRLDPLLGALAAIAADQRAAGGPWLAACGPLLQYGKRKNVRLVLQNHAAMELAKDVNKKDDATVAERARQAMRVVIECAALKPPRTGWASSEELLREARDVCAAFVALDQVPIESRLDQPRHRLLRLSACLAAGKPLDVVQRGTPWLDPAAAANGGGDDAFRDQLRLLLAEAQLALNKPEEARKQLDARAPGVVNDPQALDLTSRVARELLKSDAAGASAMFDRVLQATAPEDPAFRGRLLDWLRCKLQQDPAARDEAWQVAERHAAMFAAADCPAEQQKEFEQLRAQR
ncbi:MAG: hypothetical protein H6835_19390 [Planctomycetes bacterium]|nr:hypothetical protein [Planctomycetota bacterium]